MLAVVVIAALTPNVGVGAAQAQCQYNCTSSGPTTLEYALIGVLVAAIVTALVGLLIFQRRKRGGPGAGGVAAWEETQGGSPGPGPSMDDTGGTGGMAPAGATLGGMGAAAAAPSYDEAAPPVEVGPEWAEPAAAATVGSADVAPIPPPMDDSEPDIDRLMKELDQISDDILKKSPPKKGAPPDTPPDETNA